MAPRSGPELSLQPHRPVLVLAWLEIGPAPEHAQLAAFIAAVKAAGLPAEVSLYIGTYGPNQATADAVKALPAIYAPLFSILPSTSKGAYRGRRLTAEQNALLDPKYDRPVPLASAGKPLPASDHLTWGLELGRRFRDQMRSSGRGGAAIAATWQLDEILREVVDGPNADAHKLYAAGILDGLRLGRPELGDVPQHGVVFAARATLVRLPELAAPTGTPVARLWVAIDKAAHSYVGEEYMNFDGDPAQAATLNAAGQKQMLAAGPTRRRVGIKYVAGMTPGQVTTRASAATCSTGRAPVSRPGASATSLPVGHKRPWRVSPSSTSPLRTHNPRLSPTRWLRPSPESAPRGQLFPRARTSGDRLSAPCRTIGARRRTR